MGKKIIKSCRYDSKSKAQLSIVAEIIGSYFLSKTLQLTTLIPGYAFREKKAALLNPLEYSRIALKEKNTLRSKPILIEILLSKSGETYQE